MYKLFLDDVRNPIECGGWMKHRTNQFHVYNEPDWKIARSFDEFVKMLDNFGVPDLVSFDHDLADEHYRPSMYAEDGHYSNYYTDGTFKEKTGYDCAKYLSEYCRVNNVDLPSTILIHSMNPIGGENIANVFHR